MRAENDTEPKLQDGSPQSRAICIFFQVCRLELFDLGLMDQVCNRCGVKHRKATIESNVKKPFESLVPIKGSFLKN